MNTQDTSRPAAETATAAQETAFAVVETRSEEIEVVEFENAPLTDVNFGF